MQNKNIDAFFSRVYQSIDHLQSKQPIWLVEQGFLSRSDLAAIYRKVVVNRQVVKAQLLDSNTTHGVKPLRFKKNKPDLPATVNLIIGQDGTISAYIEVKRQKVTDTEGVETFERTNKDLRGAKKGLAAVRIDDLNCETLIQSEVATVDLQDATAVVKIENEARLSQMMAKEAEKIGFRGNAQLFVESTLGAYYERQMSASKNVRFFSSRQTFTVQEKLTKMLDFSVQQRLDWTRRLLIGLNTMHANGYVHGAIRAENLYVYQFSNRYMLRIAHFGSVVPIPHANPADDMLAAGKAIYAIWFGDDTPAAMFAASQDSTLLKGLLNQNSRLRFTAAQALACLDTPACRAELGIPVEATPVQQLTLLLESSSLLDSTGSDVMRDSPTSFTPLASSRPDSVSSMSITSPSPALSTEGEVLGMVDSLDALYAANSKAQKFLQSK